MEKSPLELRYDKLGPRVVKALEARRFKAWYVETPGEGLEKILSLIPPADVVSWGGSLTIAGLGILERLVEEGRQVLDRDKAKSPEERMELMRRALTCDTYLMGCNGISEDGQLVNIDGAGNRMAAMIFGPRQVIMAVGMNKVVKSLEDARRRARTVAAPGNVQRFANAHTPCSETGSCADCTSADSVCTYLVTTRLCRPAGRIKVILIGKDLGL
jgi:hypothetical protein